MSQRTIQPETSVGESGGRTMEYEVGVQQGLGGSTPGSQQQYQPGGQQYQPGGQQQYQPGGQQGSAGGGQQRYQSSGQQPAVQPGGQQGLRTGGQRGSQIEAGEAPQSPAGEFESSLTSDMRLALHDFVQAATVCEWCADRCITEGPEMAECIRLCRDVADLALQNVQFMARDSPFGPEIAETFAIAAEECADECARHSQPHCQECANELRRAVDSTWRMLESFERQQAGAAQQQLQQY